MDLLLLSRVCLGPVERVPAPPTLVKGLYSDGGLLV
jgi:hypothetical protein